MRYVNFVKSLVVERLPLAGREMAYYTQDFTCVDDNGEPAMLYTDSNITEHVIPVHMISHINKGERVETFIAYSKEVEELIEIPFKAITEELFRANIYKRKIKTATWINRLVYLFTGKLR